MSTSTDLLWKTLLQCFAYFFAYFSDQNSKVGHVLLSDGLVLSIYTYSPRVRSLRGARAYRDVYASTGIDDVRARYIDAERERTIIRHR